MNVFYNGTDITEYVQVRDCMVHDTAGERSDSITIEFENAAGWANWNPKKDDSLQVVHDGYDSGVMYVNQILPEDGSISIIASSLPVAARTKRNKAYQNKTIKDIMKSCSAETGMGYKIYGIDGNTVIPYIERVNEGCAAFLNRLLGLESALLKCLNGSFVAIGINYAQDSETVINTEVMASQEGFSHTTGGKRYKSVTVKSPYAQSSANDYAATDGDTVVINNLPVNNNIQAGRWARGTVLCKNRKAETVRLETSFANWMSALSRINITGNSDANGEWMIDDVEHDLINLKSTATLVRCIRTIS